MGATAQQAGQRDQFDDLINDPEGASEDTATNDSGNSPDDDWSVPLEEDDSGQKPKEMSSGKDEIDTFENLKDSQLNALDKKEDEPEDKEEDEEDDEKEPEKDDKGEKEGKEDEKDDKSKPEDEQESKEDKKPEGKTLRLFQDGKKYEVPVDAQVRVKVAGKWEKVPVSELRDNYAGKQHWDQKFEEIGNKEQTLSQKAEELTRVQTHLRSTIEDTTSALSEALQEGGDPMQAVNKIVDMLNVDSYDFNRALFSHMQEKLETLSTMDEYEREAYWLREKNEHLSKKHESFEESLRNTQAREERISKIDQMREAHGVSEDDFVSAFNELSNNGQNEVELDRVVQWASAKPHIMNANELIKPYEDQLSDDEIDQMVARVASTMKGNPELTKEDMATWLASYYEVEDYVEQANSKAGKLEAGNKDQSDKTPRISQRDLYQNPSLESFEDFE